MNCICRQSKKETLLFIRIDKLELTLLRCIISINFRGIKLYHLRISLGKEIGKNCRISLVGCEVLIKFRDSKSRPSRARTVQIEAIMRIGIFRGSRRNVEAAPPLSSGESSMVSRNS